MIISKYFFPDLRYHSIKDIDVKMLADMGIRYAILDIDNTLVPYTSPNPDDTALEFLGKLKNNNISFCFVSNNNYERINIFNADIGANVYTNAKKPLLYGISRAMKDFNSNSENTVMIGDQIFTDVCGGKRAKILTILVDPIKEVDTLFFRFKRYFERIIIKNFEYSKRGNGNE